MLYFTFARIISRTSTSPGTTFLINLKLAKLFFNNWVLKHNFFRNKLFYNWTLKFFFQLSGFLIIRPWNMIWFYLGLTLVGEEDSDLEDFLVGELEGELCSIIRTIPGIYPGNIRLEPFPVYILGRLDLFPVYILGV